MHVKLPFLILAMSGVLLGPEQASGADAIVPAEKIQLFNGTNLAGFHTWLVDAKNADPRHVFTVTNGLIHISGDGLGYLSTDREFRDYRLVAEFKWGRTNFAWGNRINAARDSGIFLHATGPNGNSYDGHGAFKAAIECNIFQGATGDLLLIRGTNADGSSIAPRLTAEVTAVSDTDGWPKWQRGGKRRTIVGWGRLNWAEKDPNWRDALDYRGSHDVEQPYGEWNEIECYCDGGHILTVLNHKVVNEAFDVMPRRGKILLQCEGSEIHFRKLELHPLKPKSSP